MPALVTENECCYSMTPVDWLGQGHFSVLLATTTGGNDADVVKTNGRPLGEPFAVIENPVLSISDPGA